MRSIDREGSVHKSHLSCLESLNCEFCRKGMCETLSGSHPGRQSTNSANLLRGRDSVGTAGALGGGKLGALR